MNSRMITKQVQVEQSRPKKLRLLTAASVTLTALTLHVQGQQVQPSGTPQIPRWQQAAGGKLEFEVASVRRRAPGSAYYPGNLDLDATDYFRYTGGLVTTNGRLINYILFAYKISDPSQYPLLQAQLPKWAQTEEFIVDARGAASPTKDQLRLMMQSLLAARFQLVLHTETRQLPAYALVLDKPGKPGPQLQPHPDDELCTKMPDKSAPPAKATGAQPWCGLIVSPVNGQSHVRMMAFTMEQIEGGLEQIGTLMGGLEPLPVLDETGLTGTFDIDLEFLRTPKNPSPPATDSAPTDPAPTFTDALKTQAGLKLIKQTALVNVFVIDHVEPPTEN
jgi:uncharacterized protein (TIGR03435 family)